MFATLYRDPAAVNRHNAAPWRQERESYLEHLARAGYTRKALTDTAACLLRVVRELKIPPSARVSIATIRNAACRSIKSVSTAQGRSLPPHEYFIQVATQWLRFLGWLSIPPKIQPAYAHELDEFAEWEDRERGIASTTLQNQKRQIQTFLDWYDRRGRTLSEITIADIDAFVAFQGRKSWSRRTIHTACQSLRNFCRYGAARGWLSRSIADGIEGPRVYSQETLPASPTWEQVQSIISGMNTEQPNDIRDSAIIMLLAVYGLRASEVAQLRLGDIDWEHEHILLRRVKNHEVHTAPLVPVVGDALVHYLREVRPKAPFREVFLTLQAPTGPMSRMGIYRLTKKQFVAHGINTLHRGPHALRHACAARLVSGGFPFNEIGNHLGHRGTAATQIYAKVDLRHLREVADIDLGGLL